MVYLYIMYIITIIAANIDCKDKLTNFLKLLKIINEQVYSGFDVLISLSYQNMDLDEIKFLVSSFNQHNFKFFYQDNLMSQFNHYKLLLDTINEPDTWILFSEPDDWWADNRVGAFYSMISNIPLNDYEQTSAVYYKCEPTLCIYDYCVKITYLKSFFTGATDEQLANEFCDYYFLKFLNHIPMYQAISEGTDKLYEKLNHGYHTDEADAKTCIRSILDLYFALTTKHLAKFWLDFCSDVFKEKNNYELSKELKVYAVQLFLDTYHNHIFVRVPVHALIRSNT